MFKKIVLFFFEREAWLVLRRFKPKIIAVTGSVGKTSTKEAIWTLLAEHFDVAKSPKSYNSDIGVPLTILGLPNAWNSPMGWVQNIIKGFWRSISSAPYPAFLILEMGVDRPGDFDHILNYIRPETVVVTAIGRMPVHVEFFVGPEGVAAEKSKLVRILNENNTAILNKDDELVWQMKSKTKAKIISYGFSSGSDVRATGYKPSAHGMTFKIEHDGKIMPIKIDGLLGKQNVYTLLAAATVGISEGLNLIEISEGFSLMKPMPGRLCPIKGVHGSLMLDDTYNSSPVAVEAALEVLKEVKATRKIAVLGDMLELGKFSADEHRRIGEKAKSTANIFFSVGIRARAMEGAAKWFPTSEEAALYLAGFVEKGDVILVKGSQSVRMEKIVEKIMADPEQAKELLVRQEPFWKKP